MEPEVLFGVAADGGLESGCEALGEEADVVGGPRESSRSMTADYAAPLSLQQQSRADRRA